MDSLVFVKSLFFLCFVLILVYGIFLALRKRFPSVSDNSHRIKILAYKQISQKLSASLLEVDGQKFLVTESTGAISCIKIIDGINHP